MDLRAVLADFPGVRPLVGLADAWYWSRIPRFGFAGALSADGERLLQLSGRGSYDEELTVAVLGRRDVDFDPVVGISPDVQPRLPRGASGADPVCPAGFPGVRL